MVNYNIRNNIISGESSKLRRDATVKSSGKESCKKGKGGCNNFIVQRNEERKRERERERRFHAHAWRRLNYEAELVGWFYDYAGSRSSRTAYFLL